MVINPWIGAKVPHVLIAVRNDNINTGIYRTYPGRIWEAYRDKTSFSSSAFSVQLGTWVGNLKLKTLTKRATKIVNKRSPLPQYMTETQGSSGSSLFISGRENLASSPIKRSKMCKKFWSGCGLVGHYPPTAALLGYSTAAASLFSRWSPHTSPQRDSSEGAPSRLRICPRCMFSDCRQTSTTCVYYTVSRPFSPNQMDFFCGSRRS